MKQFTVKELIAFFGGQVALGEKLEIGQPAISGWVKKGEVPILRAWQIQELTKGKIKINQLPLGV